MTEAWWAARVQPPSLGTMTRWLSDDFGRVVEGIKNGFDGPLRATTAGGASCSA